MNKEKLKELEIAEKLYNEFISDFKNIAFKAFLYQKRKELEEPTYKTEDGFDVKEGDKVYYAHFTFEQIYEKEFSKDFMNKQFKLKENAENYFIENVNILSLADINLEYPKVAPMLSPLHATLNYILKQKIREKLKI